MGLNNELKGLLSGFEKRMKFINIVRCLLDYRYPDSIREVLPDKKILDNTVVAVLVYIKERTLANQQNCTIDDIEHFLESFSVVFPDDYNIDCKQLARYIVVDVLQNGGIVTEFLTFDSASETFVYKEIRLINEQNKSYHLTNDALDFLFRSKEIESELDYSVTRFRMKEYMKRDNYSEALDASRELVSRIRNMKISMDDFLLRCRENISRITIDQYDEIMLRIRNLLDSEYSELTEIRTNAENRIKTLIDAQNSGLGDNETKNHSIALTEIIKNIEQTINEQRALINKKSSLTEAYGAILKESFTVNRVERMNFERDILIPLRNSNDRLTDAAAYLMFMLTTPEFAKQFSIENFYAPQSKINEEKDNEGVDIDGIDDDSRRSIEIRNKRYLQITEEFFSYAHNCSRFYASEFIGSLSISQLIELTEENALPDVLLKLLAMQELNIEEWKSAEKLTIEPTGVFDLSLCLEEIPQDYLKMKQISISVTDKIYSFEMAVNNSLRKITLTDFLVEVLK